MYWLWGFLFIVSAVLLSVGGLLLVHRAVPVEVRGRHNDIAGFIYAVVGVVYAVLLASMVIAVWEQFEEAEARVTGEAGEIAALYRDASELPAAGQADLRRQLRAYTRAVVGSEWATMADGRASPEAQREFDQLWKVMRQITPQTENERAWYAEFLGRLNDLSDFRQLRLHSSGVGLPHVMWVVLLAGAAVTVAFSYLFGTANLRAHAAMVAGLAGTLALVLFLAWALEHPFRGVARVEPDDFAQLLELLDVIDGAAAAAPASLPPPVQP